MPRNRKARLTLSASDKDVRYEQMVSGGKRHGPDWARRLALSEPMVPNLRRTCWRSTKPQPFITWCMPWPSSGWAWPAPAPVWTSPPGSCCGASSCFREPRRSSHHRYPACLGAITPFGGLAFIAGWAVLAFSLSTNPAEV